MVNSLSEQLDSTPKSRLRSAIRLLIICMLIVFGNAQAIDPKAFSDQELAERYTTMIAELRCLVCQNQNLADSDAPLAADLREEVYRMIEDGQSDDEIKTFLVERYGDFVLYRPPFQQNTLALWLGPLLFMLIGLVMAIRYLKSKQAGLGSEQEEEFGIPEDEEAP